MLRWIILIALLIIIVIFGWLLTTKDLRITPYRNFAEYQILSRWWDLVGPPQNSGSATLRGAVQNQAGQPVEKAWILLSRWDGKTYKTQSETDGSYLINNIPAGRYVIATGAPGYENQLIGSKWRRVKLKDGEEKTLNVALQTEAPIVISPGTDLQLGEIQRVSCTNPLESRANRREVSFNNDGRPNNLTYFYTPITATESSVLPLLLIIYPGPVESWECASAPLSEAGYAVIAIGPEYTLDLDKNVDELERLRQFAAAGQFPGVSLTQAALLGGSFSSLHVQRMLQRNPDNFDSAVLLGPPTDIYKMRYQFEEGILSPPFGLDKVAIALGLPDREAELYWKYSGAYHVRPDLPPQLIVHSRSDEIVPPDQSEFLAEQLARIGAPHHLHIYEGDSHYLMSETDEGIAIYKLTLDFLKEHFEDNQ